MNDNHKDLPPALREILDRQPEAARKHAEQMWHLLGQAEPPALDVPDDDTSWEALQRQLDSEQTRRPSLHAPDRRGRRLRRKWQVGLVVGFLTVILVAIGWWQQPVTVIASPGEQLTVTFPDGSTALLNSGTRLQYARRFEVLPLVAASQRQVQLEGEAFFQVVSADRAFVVETFNAQVEVLGTVFNVRARQSTYDQETWITMVEGRVRVTAKLDAAPEIMLTTPGQEVHIGTEAPDQPQQSIQIENLDRVLAWRTQGFAVVDWPIARILDEIERRYALEIAPEKGIALTDSMSLFYLRGATPERILHDLCLEQGCTYRRTSTGFVLAPIGP